MTEQLEFFPINDPCDGTCDIDNTGYCSRCFRNSKESRNWHTMTNSEKRKILQLCILRRARTKSVSQKKDKLSDLQQSLF